MDHSTYRASRQLALMPKDLARLSGFTVGYRWNADAVDRSSKRVGRYWVVIVGCRNTETAIICFPRQRGGSEE